MSSIVSSPPGRMVTERSGASIAGRSRGAGTIGFDAAEGSSSGLDADRGAGAFAADGASVLAAAALASSVKVPLISLTDAASSPGCHFIDCPGSTTRSGPLQYM